MERRPCTTACSSTANRVVAVEARDEDKWNPVRVEHSPLQEAAGLGLDLVVPLSEQLTVFSSILLTATIICLTPSVYDRRMCSRLVVLRDTSLKLTKRRRTNKDTNISLRRPRGHVLDEVTVARSVDGREVALARLRLPQGCRS